MDEEEAIRDFRAANRAMPLSAQARWTIAAMLLIAAVMGAAACFMTGAGPVIAMAALAAVPVLLSAFIVHSEKVAGRKPDRTLVIAAKVRRDA